MTKPIQPGDLVMVVRGHACILGRVGVVESEVYVESVHCGCGWRMINIGPLVETTWCDGVPVSWLKRIDPPAEHERVETDEKVYV